jgi:hypothetical protein
MNTKPTPEAASPDPAPDQQQQIYLQLIHELLAMLPPPGAELLRAIVSGDSPHLRAADAMPMLAR